LLLLEVAVAAVCVVVAVERVDTVSFPHNL
jgi:hypothetical protein